MSELDFERRTVAGSDALIGELLDVMSEHMVDMQAKEVVCVAAAAVADFARLNFGDGCLEGLAELIQRRDKFPMMFAVDGVN